MVNTAEGQYKINNGLKTKNKQINTTMLNKSG